MPSSRLFLIDAHALCYRSFFAIKSLSTSNGQATNAVYGFLNALKKILRDYQPDYMAVCFDSGKKTKRQERFKAYKINRPVMPDDLVSQIPLIKKMVLAYNLPIFELEGFEADDLIATITRRLCGEKLDVVIVSDDKDMIQLMDGDRVKLLNSRREGLLGWKEAQEVFGIDPKHIPDFIGLAGDKVDNIPGVIGIGEVTARTLINEFGTLEQIFEKILEIKSDKTREKLLSQKESALISKELAILDDNVPVKTDLKDFKVHPADKQKLYTLFQELEFKKFAEEVSSGMVQAEAPVPVIEVENSQIKDLISKIEEKGTFAFHLNCTDATDERSCSGVYVFFGSDAVYHLSSALMIELKGVLESKEIIKITHDFKQSLKVFSHVHCAIRGKIFDCMLAGFLLIPQQGNFEAAQLAWVYLKKTISTDQKLSQEVVMLLELYPILLRELKEKDLLKLFEEIEMPLAYVLFRMEMQGVDLDEDLLKELSIQTQKRIEGLVCKIYEMAGMECNLNSPKQLSELLFTKMQLPVVKKTKTGFSTDEGVLVKLAETHEIAAIILEYRQLTKLKSTYIDALPQLVRPETHRLHAYFKQTGAETGRLSSLNPNLQNIPIRNELGRQIRKAFIPYKSDHQILSADYSQIELRILAYLSKDKNLNSAFIKDEDIHTYTAALIFDTTEENVTSAMRNTAKRVNFGIIYGISSFGLAKDLKISTSQAQEFIDRYFLRYPDIKNFMDQEIEKAKLSGYVLTVLNRRRYLPEINSRNNAIQQFAERQAINTPVQGSAADLMKLAMINIQKELEVKSLSTKMIITVHDELVFDSPLDEENVVVPMIRKQMEECLDLSVPIKVTIKKGRNWLELKEVL